MHPIPLMPGGVHFMQEVKYAMQLNPMLMDYLCCMFYIYLVALFVFKHFICTPQWQLLNLEYNLFLFFIVSSIKLLFHCFLVVYDFTFTNNAKEMYYLCVYIWYYITYMLYIYSMYKHDYNM